MKVLLSAFACAPGAGSEPNIGWNVAVQVARWHDTWVMTEDANRPLIQRALAHNDMPRLRPVFVRIPKPLHGRQDAGLVLRYLYYWMWQIQALRVARRLQKQVGFDLIHHVTYGNSWQPTWLGCVGVPFIWSAGGRDVTPWRFLKGMSWRSRLSEVVRTIAVVTLGRLMVRLAGARATLVFTSSNESMWPSTVEVTRLPIGGLDEEERAFLAVIPPRTQAPFRVLSVGRLLGWKGFHLALEAFSHLRQEFPTSEYWLIGDGPEMPFLQRRARELGCDGAVRFFGWLPRRDVWQRLAEVDVLVHPSLHEQFGYVIIEAMAAKRPVVCVDIGGPSVIVGDGGMRVPCTTPKDVVLGIYSALSRLAGDPPTALRLGELARRRVDSHFSWPAVAGQVLRAYRPAGIAPQRPFSPRGL